MTVGRRLLTLVLAVSILVGVGPGAARSDPADPVRIDLVVLLIENGGGSPSLGAWIAWLTREGVPFDVFDAASDTLTAADLSAGNHAFYEAVVCATSCASDLGWGSTELATLDAFQATFGIRRADAFAFPSSAFGLNEVSSGAEVAGDTLSLTAAGRTVFPYLEGTIPIDAFTWGYYGTVADPDVYETLVAGPGDSSVVGVYQNPAGFDELVVTIDANEHQMQSLLLGHGQLNWVTKGIYLGYGRNYFTAHFDDIFMPDDRWDMVNNITPEDGGATLPSIRMVPGDVTRALAWQAVNRIRLDLVFSGAGSDEAVAESGSDPLTEELLAHKASFYWINHTYGHINLDTVVQAVIVADIQSNLDFATANGIPYESTELVTGEHSGLHNPAMPAALAGAGIAWIAADNSREPVPYGIGPARTVPRYPSNVYYNVGTRDELLDEYNYLYDSGEGCVPSETTTCNDGPVSWETYVDREADIILSHLLTNDPRPHYFHQSNLAEDGTFYLVFDEVLDRYNRYFTVDLIQPTFTESGEIMQRASAWAAAEDGITAYRQGGSVHLSSPSDVYAPVTGILAGDLYGGERSDWILIGPDETIIGVDEVAPPPPAPDPIDHFVDDDGSVFEDEINAIAAAGITRGCNPPVNDMFCWNRSVTRGEMAAFLARALDL